MIRPLGPDFSGPLTGRLCGGKKKVSKSSNSVPKKKYIDDAAWFSIIMGVITPVSHRFGLLYSTL